MILLLLFTYFFGSDATDKLGVPMWTILVAILGLIWLYKKNFSKKKDLNGLKEIPGPKGLPIIGSMHNMGIFPNKQFSKWSEEYGDIYKVQLGNIMSIIISDPKMAKEIFSDSALTGRLQLSHFGMYPDTLGLGVFNSEGERWEVHRRFLLRQLRDFGFGKSSMEALILEEVTGIIDMYKKKAGQPVGKVRETLRLAVVNSLWKIMTSKRFEQDDPVLLRLTDNTSRKFNEVVEKGGALIFIPWIRHILPKLSGYTDVREVIDENRAMFEKVIAEKKRNYKDGDLNDFIDVYLAEMKKAENDPSSTFHGKVAEKHLANILFDLFFAGNDTTAMTTAWSLLYLCKWPHVQEKLQKEIDEVVGNTRRVSVDDRPKMTYAVALIDEVLRYSSIVPDGVQHRALTDREFRGYFIPKNALVQPNMHYIHFNPKIWGDPETFRPERFIVDGKYKKNENLMPFQVGRRQCLGEALARDSIFLYIINLFQQFSIKFDPNMKEEVTLEAEPGFLLGPKPFSVIMTDRLGGKL